MRLDIAPNQVYLLMTYDAVAPAWRLGMGRDRLQAGVPCRLPEPFLAVGMPDLSEHVGALRLREVLPSQHARLGERVVHLFHEVPEERRGDGSHDASDRIVHGALSIGLRDRGNMLSYFALSGARRARIHVKDRSLR